MRRGTHADIPAIAAFLEARLERAMFPLANLSDHGLAEARADPHPFAMSFWLQDGAGGIDGVVGQTAHGILLPVAPGRDADLPGLGPVTGIIGPAGEARALERALDLTGAPRTIDHDEAHLALDLARLIVPDGPGTLRPMGEAPEGEIREWMADYHRAALATPAHLIGENVALWWRRACDEDTHRVLMDGDTALAMTGFNARVPAMVQVGGVYTPPGRRGQGHARRALGLDLAQGRADGTRGATLFASGPAAVRTYEALGFRRIGDWTLLLFDGPQNFGSAHD